MVKIRLKKRRQTCWAIWQKVPGEDRELVAVYPPSELQTAQIVLSELRADCPQIRYWIDSVEGK